MNELSNLVFQIFEIIGAIVVGFWIVSLLRLILCTLRYREPTTEDLDDE